MKMFPQIPSIKLCIISLFYRYIELLEHVAQNFFESGHSLSLLCQTFDTILGDSVLDILKFRTSGKFSKPDKNILQMESVRAVMQVMNCHYERLKKRKEKCVKYV